MRRHVYIGVIGIVLSVALLVASCSRAPASPASHDSENQSTEGTIDMGAAPKAIWRVPAYLPYLQPELTDAMVADAVKELGFELPEEYLALLRTQNGGYIRYSLPDVPHSQIYGIGPHFPSLTDVDWSQDQEYIPFKLKGLIPFDGDGHWHLCLDYRESRTSPAVAYVDVEVGKQRKVADSFAEYLALLELEADDGELVIPSIEDLESLTNALAEQLGVRFEPPDSWAHGYPEYRAQGGTENAPEWIWISPNTVPRGFVREDHARYDELHSLLPGTAPRDPRVPGEAYFLNSTEGLRPGVLDVCQQLSVDVRELAEYEK